MWIVTYVESVVGFKIGSIHVVKAALFLCGLLDYYSVHQTRLDSFCLIIYVVKRYKKYFPKYTCGKTLLYCYYLLYR